MNFVLTNWRTSAAGVLGAIPQIVQGVQTKNWTLVATGVCTLIGFLLAKDGNVTGGNVVQ